MKEKIKIFIFNSFIFYVIIIIILTIVNMLNFISEIELNNNDENNSKIIVLEDRVNKLENSACKSLLKEMINTYNETSYDGIVKLSEFYNVYWNGTSILQFYNQIEEKCNINNEEMKNIDLHRESLNSVLYIENLVGKHMFQYEINLIDNYMHEIGEANTINMQYQLSKASELKIIENILDYIGGYDD